jgi:hypothetical protein
MSSRSDAARRVQVYAIVRVDEGSAEPQVAITVKEVVPTLQEATREVERLNADAPTGARCFCQMTRYYPGDRREEGLNPLSR